MAFLILSLGLVVAHVSLNRDLSQRSLRPTCHMRRVPRPGEHFNLMAAIFTWLSSWFPNLNRPPTATIQVLRIPADSSPPHTLPLQTIDISAERNVDSCFHHIPDMRSFWGSGEGWQWRDFTQCTITHRNPDINGVYLAWKSFAMHLLPLNKNASGCGDVFIAKLAELEHDEDGWTRYEHVSSELLESGLYKVVLQRLAEN
jgi:hypothetical protein